jgi:hypothetical protein
MSIIGIDIGARGALALLSPTGELIEVADMPILRDGPANRPNVNAPLLANIVRRWQASQAFIEYVDARPKEGPTGAFAFGCQSALNRAPDRRPRGTPFLCEFGAVGVTEGGHSPTGVTSTAASARRGVFRLGS